MAETEHLPGDFFVTSISGTVGRLISVGEWLNGDGFGQWDHAGVYLGDGTTVEAQPGGAARQRLASHDPSRLLWSTGRIPLTDAQRTAIVTAATGYLGTPYSAADYFAIAAHRLRLPLPWLRTYVASSKHMICSQLVDRCYRDAGVQLFADGRWDGYVTPAELAGVIEGGPSGGE